MITADQDGIVTGEFNVPENIPAGTKLVEFEGEMNSRGESTYTGRGRITVRELQRVTTVISRRPDPLAQTFTMAASRQLAGVDLWFTRVGTSQVRVQIRETELGMPNQIVLAEAILMPDDLPVDGTPARFRFDPILGELGREYAIVVLTDDADHEVRIAEVGKWDEDRGWVTSQPYQVGVLLSSSNAVTWTPHQNSDLTFRLYAAEFTHHQREVDLGTYSVQDATDFILLAAVHRTSSQADIRFRLTDQVNNRSYEVQDNQVLTLPDKLTGNVQVTAILSGEDNFSPVLFPGAQLAKGTIHTSADYVSREIPCESGDKLTITFDALVPGDARIKVQVQESQANADKENWPEISYETAEPLGDGWMEFRYTRASLAANATRIRLVLEGNAQNRPRVRNLRAVTT